MIFAASLVCRNELDRYLPLVIEHLRAFCDQINVLDDASTDGTLDWLRGQVDGQLSVTGHPSERFDEHEGHVRQALLEFTLARAPRPTHVLAIDADEFIEDGVGLRALIAGQPSLPAWTLTMTEVWNASYDTLRIRMDGAWRPYDRIHVWRAPVGAYRGVQWRIADRRLACSPIPMGASQARRRAGITGQRIFHFGWTDAGTRPARYERYMRLDAGRYHARSHLQSIMWPPDRIELRDEEWPQTDWADKLRSKAA